MTHTELLDALATYPTETHLSDIAYDAGLPVTILPDALNNLDAIGHAAVLVDDGLLLIPYNEVSLGDGWEQFDLDQAVLMAEPPEYRAAAAAYAQAQDRLVELLTTTRS